MIVPVAPPAARCGQRRLIEHPTVTVEHYRLGAGRPYVDAAEDHGPGPQKPM